METGEKKDIQSKNVHHGHTLKRLRRARGITQKQLAQLMHLSQQQISYYEEQEEMEEKILNEFAKVLEVPVEMIKNMEEDTKLSFYIENNTQENENSPSSNMQFGTDVRSTTNNYTDKALYDALEQMQKLYEKGMQLYESSLQANNQLLQSLITILGKQNK